MALDRPDALGIDVLPELLCRYRGIFGMAIATFKAAFILLMTSEDSQIMKKGDTDDLSFVDVDPGLADHITHGKSGSGGMDGMITD